MTRGQRPIAGGTAPPGRPPASRPAAPGGSASCGTASGSTCSARWSAGGAGRASSRSAAGLPASSGGTRPARRLFRQLRAPPAGGTTRRPGGSRALRLSGRRPVWRLALPPGSRFLFSPRPTGSRYRNKERRYQRLRGIDSGLHGVVYFLSQCRFQLLGGRHLAAHKRYLEAVVNIDLLRAQIHDALWFPHDADHLIDRLADCDRLSRRRISGRRRGRRNVR